MAFRRRSRPVARQGVVVRLWAICSALVLLLARLVLSVAALAVFAAVIVYLHLLQGPIALPGMARILAEQVNEARGRVRVRVGTVVLTLGEDAATSGLQLRDVELSAPDGQRLLAAPRVGARFRLPDLLHGRLQPVRITLIESDARIIRTEDGQVRIGMGSGAGVSLGGADTVVDGSDQHRAAVPDEDGVRRDAGLQVLSRLLDGIVGDAPPVPELARLERIEVLGANLTFDDRQSGGHWATQDADLRLWRYAGGARAVLNLEPTGDAGAALSIAADRPVGPGRTDLTLQVNRIGADRLARQIAELDWLGVIGGTVSGVASASLDRDGSLSALHGVIVAQRGMIRGLGDPMPFDTAELRFRAEPAEDRIAIDRLRLRAPALTADLAGYAELDRDPGGALQGLAGQFDLGPLHLDMPDHFAAPLDFDSGRLTARWSLPEQRIEVTGSRLVRGDLAFNVDGRVQRGAAGWSADLRADAEGMTVRDLVALWPVSAADNARSWIDQHVTAAEIDRATAQVRLGDGEQVVSVDFDYSGLRIDYIDGMTPIEEGRGTGHVSLNDLFMVMDSGRGSPLPGKTIELDGSSLAIRSFWGDIPPADVSIRANGPVEAVLALIDQPPLRLLGRLGRPLDVTAGRATVEAELSIPLLKDLRLVDIGVHAHASLSDVAMPFQVSPGRTVDVSGGRLDLAADTTSLHLSGDALIDGTSVEIDWTESFGPGQDGRTITLTGTATPDLLAAVGAGGLPLEGAPAFELALRQAGGGALAFTLDADLEPAGLDLAALEWKKPPGVPASLHAEGSEGTGGLDVTRLVLDSPGLGVEGSLSLDAGGGLVRAALPRVQLADRGIFAATLRRGSDGVLEVGITGQRLDLSDRIDAAGEGGGAETAGPAMPVRLKLNVERLRLGRRVLMAPASGEIEQHASGALDGEIEGRLGAAPATLTVDLPVEGSGTVVLTSPDAGGVLRATDLYTDAAGGSLVVSVRVGGPGGATLAGDARIEDVRVRSQSTFRTMLRQGGLDQAEQEVASNGIGFRKVEIPFTYDGGVLRVKDAIASSPALGLKVNGTIDEQTDQVDMVGVLSPAYGLTGALNEVPLLGQILGGEGEGVLAMTFRLSGPVEDPRFTVNPLSMLAPGFLRKIFTAPTSEVSEDFQRRITRRNR